ncbi:succinate dehydrogenase cytochrome b subunit, partial [Candidatus Entotheonella palauensis]
MHLTSILKKTLMAVTGLVWFLFIVGHLMGNLLLMVGPETYNAYAKALVSNPLIYPAEVLLAVFLLVHIFTAYRITNENNEARPNRYMVKAASTGSSTFASRTMIYGGAILFVFLILHLIMFKFGDHEGEKGLWGLVVSWFHNPWVVIGYIIAMIPLGMHLSHGFASALQTLSAIQPQWYKGFKQAGQALGWLLA